MSRCLKFVNNIRTHIYERAKQNIPQLPLDVAQTKELITIIKNNDIIAYDKPFILNQLTDKITPGVDETSKLKAEYLHYVCKYDVQDNIVSPKEAIKLLGTMQGGYNVNVLTSLLDDERYQLDACEQLKSTILIFDSLYDIEEKYKKGNPYAKELLESWADAEWFLKNQK